ncbi:MAG: glycosyltransferase family 1 protein [Rikenellaceae bacterium]
MIIGIDYRLAASSHRGMGRYCREIVEKLFIMDTKNQYVLYIDDKCDKPLPHNFRFHKLPTSNFIIGEQIIMPFFIIKDKIDVLWSPSNTFPLITPRHIKLVTTIHDLIFMYKLPKGQNFIQRVGALYRRYVLKLGHKRIDSCITVSEFSASEIKRIFNITDVTITYNCIEAFYKKTKDIKQDKKENFYFTLSADAPSKNLKFLLEAFRNKLSGEKLIIAGVKDTSPLRELYSSQDITFLNDGISDDELIKLYMSCKAFIYVSLQEGFGIPPLEALSCGSKVICSYATSLREVVGECGILIDPKNEDSLLKAISDIDNFDITQEKIDLHLSQFIDWSVPASIVLKTLTSK